MMKKVKTYTATIYCGTRAGYTEEICDGKDLYDYCQAYCNTHGLCISVSPVDFIYTDGNEQGFAITLINYPRFPSTRKAIREHAFEIAKRLLWRMNQNRISVVCSDKTYMLEA